MKAVNLIPSEDRARGVGVGVGRSQGAAYGVLALLAGLALLALVYGLAHHQSASRRSELAKGLASAPRGDGATAALSSYASFDAVREQRFKAVNELVGARFDWAHALHELGRVMPNGTAISTLSGTIGASPAAAASAAKTSTTEPTSTGASATGSTSATATPVTSATPPGSVPTITLGGCATSQAKVAQTLQRLRLIDGVSKVSLQSSAKASASGGSGGGSNGGCNGAAFTVTLTFQALPVVSSVGKAGAELTSSTGSQK